MADFSALSMSPDGSSVAFAKEVHHDKTLWIQPIGTHRATRLTAGTGKPAYDEFEPVWAPDGHAVAFLYIAKRARDCARA